MPTREEPRPAPAQPAPQNTTPQPPPPQFPPNREIREGSGPIERK
jgi:hypothetical protein